MQSWKQVTADVRIFVIMVAGQPKAFIYTSGGDLYSFGRNIDGRLGLNDLDNRDTPTNIPNIAAIEIAAGSGHSLVIDKNNNLYAFGYNGLGGLGTGDTDNRIKPVKIGTGYVKISAADHSLALMAKK